MYSNVSKGNRVLVKDSIGQKAGMTVIRSL